VRIPRTLKACNSLIYRLIFCLSAVCPPLSSAYVHHFWRTIGGQLDVHKSTKMSIEISGKVTRNGQKIWYTYEWGKGPSERKAAGIFTYTKPKDQIQKNHNKEALALLNTKKSQMVIDQQSIGTPFIPTHRFKENFLDYYAGFVEENKRPGNRHLQGSLNQFRLFIKKPRILPMEITENLSKRFRTFLADKFTGKTPADYFRSFKRVVRSATKDGYFRIHPAEDVKSKTNASKKIKESLEAEEYLRLLALPLRNREIRDAFIFSCYTGLRWCDVRDLQWSQIKDNTLTTTIIQKKTGKPVRITLHRITQIILDMRREKMQISPEQPNTQRSKPIFSLPTADGANKAIRNWVKRAGIDKDITWSCARLSFSILLQDANADAASVALLLGHTTTRYVNETYKRHSPKDQSAIIAKLPDAEWNYN
jgi:integrase